MALKKDIEQELVQLSRLALSGRRQDIQMYIRRLSKKLRENSPKISESLDLLLIEAPSPTMPLRGAAVAAMPVDVESRLQLARTEYPVKLNYEPIWSHATGQKLDQIIEERKNQKKLLKADLAPSKAVLFTGPPGVGKTMAAKWIASKLDLPLIVLDLSAVMSRFLGKTGSNVRNVLDYAKSTQCVLLLDEFDSIAKKRNDDAEVGELKRLVTVLLQEIDDWPSTALLIAATNHPELLDPAVWRRFDLTLEFTMPHNDQIVQALQEFLGKDYDALNEGRDILVAMCKGLSFSDIEKRVHSIKRQAVLKDKTLDKCVVEGLSAYIDSLPRGKLIELAIQLESSGLSQREAHRITGVSRDTIRKKKGDAK